MDTNFSVHTYALVKDGTYTHWAEGLKMVIKKDGIILRLSSDEIKELVKSLPQTVGGSY